MRIMTVRAQDALINRLNEQAKNLGITRNALILIILNEWLNKKSIKDGEERL